MTTFVTNQICSSSGHKKNFQPVSTGKFLLLFLVKFTALFTQKFQRWSSMECESERLKCVFCKKKNVFSVYKEKAHSFFETKKKNKVLVFNFTFGTKKQQQCLSYKLLKPQDPKKQDATFF